MINQYEFDVGKIMNIGNKREIKYDYLMMINQYLSLTLLK
jgi:hypothetical protein